MALSSSPLHHPANLKRRSTGADTNHSGSGLDYYWSNVAGIGPSSSTSSLISPSPSGGLGPGGHLSPTSPTSPSRSPFHLQTRSAHDLRSIAVADAGRAPYGEEYLLDSPKSALSDLPPWPSRQPLSPRSVDSAYSLQSSMVAAASGNAGAGSSSGRRPKELLLGSSHQSQRGYMADSPVSDASAYSSIPSPLVTSIPAADYAWHYASSGPASPLIADPRRPHIDPSPAISSDSAYSASEHTARYDPVRESFVSGASTAMQSDEAHYDPHETPVAPTTRLEPVLNPPSAFNYDAPRATATPKTSGRDRRGSPAKPSSPPLRHSFDDDPQQLGRPGSTPRKASAGSSKAPKSAPPWQTEFGGKAGGDRATGGVGEDDDTLKARSRGASEGASLAPTTAPLQTQVKPRRGSDNGSQMLSPERPEFIRRSSTPGEGSGGTPSLPPRSALRGPPSPAPSKNALPAVLPTPLQPESPPLPPRQSHELPTITHTPVSPSGPSSRSAATTAEASRKPEARRDTADTLSAHSEASIAELTGMLEGAIDEIGLINSQETPPPLIHPPLEKPVAISIAPPISVESPRRADTSSAPPPRTDTSPDAHGLPAGAAPPMRHAASTLSLRSATLAQASSTSTGITLTAQPWPQAMMTGNIRNLKFAGDRAKGYAKAINELSRSESGLREWCTAASSSTHRAPAHTLSKQFTHGHLGRGEPSMSSLPGYFAHHPSGSSGGGHPRNVSSSSEFPMREDSYSAREIVQRSIDPMDQPTALPANLPYPQLQSRGPAPVSGGMKSSASMASMASTASHGKKGFFSAMRKGKKDSVSSLGPPNPGSGVSAGGGIYPSGGARGITISGPDVRSGNMPAPMGPRDPYRGSFTPPPGASASFTSSSRGSIDSGVLHTARGSFESTRTAKSSLAPTAGGNGTGSAGRSPLVDGATQVSSGYATPNADDNGLGYMCDVLPHVERSTLRLYLGRHGDSMRAIGAYLEDEKKGKVTRLGG